MVPLIFRRSAYFVGKLFSFPKLVNSITLAVISTPYTAAAVIVVFLALEMSDKCLKMTDLHGDNFRNLLLSSC